MEKKLSDYVEWVLNQQAVTKADIESQLGNSEDTENILSDEVDPKEIEEWRFDHPLQEIRDRLLEQTSLLFDNEFIVPGDKSDFRYDTGLKKRFKIASILSDLRIDFQDNGELKSQYQFDGVLPRGLLTPRDRESVECIRDERAGQLKRALSDSPDVISFCEFALPPCEFHPEDISLIGNMDVFQQDLIDRVDLRYEETALDLLNRAVMDGAEQKDLPFIFYGSAHCNLTRFNIGAVSPGGALESNYFLERMREDPFGSMRSLKYDLVDGHSAERLQGRGPIAHKKKFPARRAGERARVPDDQNFRLYKNELGYVSVLICSDAVDINQAANIVRINRAADDASLFERINLVIVPAFNKSELLFDACRDLSAMARTNVLVTNAKGNFADPKTPGRPRSMPESELFFDGYSSWQLGQKNMVETRQPFTDVKTFTIDLEFQRAVLKRVNRN